MKKKLVSVLVCLTMTAVLLAGCGEKPETEAAASAASEEAAEEAESPAEEEAESAVEEAASAAEEEAESAVEEAASAAEEEAESAVEEAASVAEEAESAVEEAASAAEEEAESVVEEAESAIEEATSADEEETEAMAEEADADQAAADEVAALIDAIYVQERTDETDAQCAEAKAAWDALTDAQKELVEGESADPDYFGRDTGDAANDDPLNADEIGENELLVVSFGTSFNDSRAEDIGGIEKAPQEAYPEWAVRRAFTAQIIINHVQARDEEFIDNMDQALERAVANGVKNLVVQPTHLMQGAEYDELCAALDAYADKFESVQVAKPLLGDVGEDETVVNDDKKVVAEAVVAAAVEGAGFESLDAAAEDGTAFVFMGHGTAHKAAVTYDQMQTQMQELGYANVYIGTVEGEPEDTACEAVIEKIKADGYTKVILRPLMVVAGDHANNDMAGDDEDSWKSMFEASGAFESVECQIEGLGRIPDVQQVYVEHTGAVIG